MQIGPVPSSNISLIANTDGNMLLVKDNIVIWAQSGNKMVLQEDTELSISPSYGAYNIAHLISGEYKVIVQTESGKIFTAMFTFSK